MASISVKISNTIRIKKSLIIIIILSIICLSVNSSAVCVRDIDYKSLNICFNGSILYVGGTGEDNYTRIQHAVIDANPGDTVFVYDDSSPYYEHIVIDKSITLIGENKNTTIIDGKKIGNVVYISTDGVNISGFTIRNCGTIAHAGIRVVSDFNNIYENILYQNGACIWLEWSSNNNVFRNEIIYKSGMGIFLYQCQDTIVRDNFIENCSDFGIYLFVKSNNNIVTGNTINSCNSGIFTEDTSSNAYSNNTITDCVYGFLGKSSTDNTISGNDISYSDFYGIWLMEFSDSLITKNIISNSDQGIYIKTDSNFNIISYNIIKKNIKGLYLWYSSNDNEIIHNTFMKNVRNVFFADSRNEWDQNYWGRPRYIPRIVVGGKTVMPYVYLMPWFEIDWNPAKEPYDLGV